MLERDKFSGAFFLFIAAVVASVGFFHGAMWSIAGILAAVGLWGRAYAQDKKPPKPDALWLLAGGAVLAVFAAEIPFSGDVKTALKTWVNLAGFGVPLMLLSAPRVQRAAFSPRLFSVLAILFGAACAVMGAELLSGGVLLQIFRPMAHLTDYNRGVAQGAVLALPLLAGLCCAGKKKEAVLLLVLLFLPCSLTESRTAKMALVFAAVVFGVARFWPVFVRRGLALACVVLGAWPLAVQKIFLGCPESVAMLVPSWRHRVEIWDYLSYRFAEHPWLGWGLGSTNKLDYTQPHGELYVYVKSFAPHAHNYIMQTMVETGLVGWVAVLALQLVVLMKIGKIEARLQPFALAAFTAAIVVGLFGFNFWTDALWAAFALTAFMFGVLHRHIENRIDA